MRPPVVAFTEAPDSSVAVSPLPDASARMSDAAVPEKCHTPANARHTSSEEYAGASCPSARCHHILTSVAAVSDGIRTQTSDSPVVSQTSTSCGYRFVPSAEVKAMSRPVAPARE